MFGFVTFQLLSGFIYGMIGFIPVYLGGFLGGISCFALSRVFFGKKYRKILSEKYPKFALIEEAIEEGGLKLVLLIRVAPYPYAIMNGVLSTTSIPFHRFAIATAVCMIKALINVYLGTTLQSIAELLSGVTGTSGTPVLQVSLMVVGLILAVLAAVYISWLVKKTLKKYVKEEDEEEEEAELDVRAIDRVASGTPVSDSVRTL
ncbi:hypothetical protein HDU97_006214 [Phlyctochytrium planicorne]|nr:hypothetical protein HDU97_006214 [Phlyctochytrium planicorne]